MSTFNYGRQSGLNTTPIVAAAIGTKIFSKAATPNPNPQTASEPGDTIRIIKNKGSIAVLIAETQAGSVDPLLAYEMAPGEAITLLGPSGIGWGGDLWASSAAGAASLHILKA